MQPRRPVSERRKKAQKGNTLVEGVIVLLVFLVMIFGLMDFGRMVWTYSMISYGAREAARYAMVHGNAAVNTATGPQIGALVTSRAVGLDPNSTVATVTFTPNQNAGSTVKVAVVYSFAPLAPYIPAGVITLKSTSQMMILQ